MKNRDIYQRDPDKIILLNNGVAAMTDAETDDDRRTLRFELEHFVCEGQYRSRARSHSRRIHQQPGATRATGCLDQRFLWKREVPSG